MKVKSFYGMSKNQFQIRLSMIILLGFVIPLKHPITQNNLSNDTHCVVKLHMNIICKTLSNVSYKRTRMTCIMYIIHLTESSDIILKLQFQIQKYFMCLQTRDILNKYYNH